MMMMVRIRMMWEMMGVVERVLVNGDGLENYKPCPFNA